MLLPITNMCRFIDAAQKLFGPWVLVFFLSFLFAACTTAPYTGRSQLVLVSTEQERTLGEEAATEVRRESKLSRDPKLTAMANSIGQSIARAANRPDFAWEFQFIDEPETINAFALPGGKVFIYTGILKLAQNEAELATVMAHEVAHVLARHGAERMSQSLLTQLGEQVALAALDIESQAAQDAFRLAFGLASNVGVILPYSRTQEFEADYIGLLLMADAGFHPNAAVSFWEKMGQQSKGKGLPVFLATHPPDDERLKRIKSALPEAMKRYGKK